MLGVSSYTPRPSATKAVIGLLTTALPEVPAMGDAPGQDDDYPSTFVVVERAGGADIAQGYLGQPMITLQCYGLNGPDAEALAEQVIAALKSAQYKSTAGVQFGRFTVIGGPSKYDDPKVPQRRRYQLTATFIMH